MTHWLPLLLLLAGPAAARPRPEAAASAPEKGPDERTKADLAEYFLKVPLSDANPKLISPFLALDPETLPKKLRRRTRSKQIEIATLLKLHETKKAGSLIQADSACTGADMVKKLDEFGLYQGLGFEEVDENDLQYVMNKTKCTEIDLGCRFSLMIFYTKPKPRRLAFYQSDPIMGLVAEARGKGGSTRFFGIGLTCLH